MVLESGLSVTPQRTAKESSVVIKEITVCRITRLGAKNDLRVPA